MTRPRKTMLHVFISSPGDCADERVLMRDVVRRVSEGDAARAAGIELQPLLWEDLPPGQAEPGDLQSRVNALLDRYGLKRYEIYAGAMKDRLGTPTAKYRSGTIEELETAIAGHRRAQVPAEVLFYFIGSGSAEVVAFREELPGRGFLFAAVADREDLERRFTEHLTRIVAEWSLWRNRMRRAFRSARSAAAIAAGILLTVTLATYLMFDYGGALRVEAALREGGATLAFPIYEREAPYLVVHKASTKRKLRDAVSAEIERSVLYDVSARNAAVLWQRTTRAGLWSADDPDTRRLLRRVAARRMIEALLADGISVAEWSQRCRPFELNALREFARSAAPSSALAKWPREQRTAVYVLAEAWPRLAESAARESETKVAMVRFAPADVASRWIAANVGKSTSDPDVHQIVEAAEERKDPAVISALLDRLQAGEIDRTVHRDDILRAIDTVGREAFAPYATAHMRRVAAGQPTDVEIYPMLFSFAPPSIPDVFVDALLKPVVDGKASDEYEVAVYRAVAVRREVRARAFLLRQYETYRSERTSFGFAQKAALIDALAAVGVPDAPGRALALAKIAHREAEELRANDWIVQAAFLRALAGDVQAWPRHASYVRDLFTRRVNPQESLIPDGIEPAAVDLLGKLSPAQIVELLALPPSIVSDELEGKWEPRWYVLRALADAGPVDDDVASAVFARLPVNDDLRLSVVRAVSRNGGKVARAFLAREYLRDRSGNRGYLAFLADLGDEAFFLERLGEEADDAVLDAAARLPDGSRCRVFTRAVQRFGKAHAAGLWIEAGRCRIADDDLADAAMTELRKPKPASAASAMRYLVAIDREQPIVADAAKLLRTAEPFEWFTLAQEIPARVATEPSIAAVLDNRTLLLVTDSAEPGSFSVGGRGISNPLLATYAARADAVSVRKLLRWGNSVKSVEVEGGGVDAPILYRAYCLWLAASAARAVSVYAISTPSESEVMASDVTALLSENNVPLIRAAAAVCLASTERAG